MIKYPTLHLDTH